jgi:hypothetical protein
MPDTIFAFTVPVQVNINVIHEDVEAVIGASRLNGISVVANKDIPPKALSVIIHTTDALSAAELTQIGG